MYAPLWCKTNFSFLEGASHPQELALAGYAFDVPALCVTDRDGVYGVVQVRDALAELAEKFQRPPPRLIIGSEISITGPRAIGTRSKMTAPPVPVPEARVLVLAQDASGYAHLCRLITLGRRRCEKGRSEVSWAELCAHAGGLLLLQPETSGPWGDLKDAFGDRAYALVQRHLEPQDPEREAALRAQAQRYGFALTAAAHVLYHDRQRQPLQDVLSCVRQGLKLAEAGQRLHSNAEHVLLSPMEFAARFGPALMRSTLEVAARCQFSLDELRYKYPVESEGVSESERLRELTWSGATWRFPEGLPESIRAQIEKELTLINKLDYGGYFLTMKELIEFCKAKNILCQGRGSAANSAVCYCLGITAVDPRRVDMLFERFLSMERKEPPDIDLDIEHERREEVIQHVYERFGREHAAMVANVIRYRLRSAVRDVGKVLGIAETVLSQLAHLLSHYRDTLTPEILETAGLSLQHATARRLFGLVHEIANFPRHLSIHPGGFLLGHEPVDHLVPVENATMPGRTVIQWDKNDVESLGLFKVDLLGLGMLSQVRGCFELVAKTRGETLTMATVPEGDLATYEMIARADTLGVFQIESRAQMSMLPRLKPSCYYDLVIEVAIVRPGPITGKMVHPYLLRREHPELVDYPHPSLEAVLKKTLGVPLFQEQVMKIAMIAADYTPGEADRLRRDIAGWNRTGRLHEHRERLLGRMIAKGIKPEFAERVFEQILGFGEYGFPESHAASFALIAYVTSYMKCHYPAEFACALLNAQPMGFYAPASILEDAKRHGVVVLPIGLAESSWDCTMEDGAIRMGLRYVRGLGERHRAAVEGARERFVRGEPLVRATKTEENATARASSLDAKTLAALARAGALGTDRRAALWAGKGDLARRGDALMLPRDEALAFTPLNKAEEITWDYNSTGLSPRGHPLSELREQLREQRYLCAREVNATRHGRRVRCCGLVIVRQRPETAGGVSFFTLEDETGLMNLVVWTDVFERFRLIARSVPFLGVRGKIQAKDGVTHVVVEELWDMGEHVVHAASHDFR